MGDLTKYFPFMAILAPLALFWSHAKTLITRTIALLWKDRTIDTMRQSYKMYDRLRKHPHYSFDDYRTELWLLYNKEKKCLEYKSVSTPFHVIFFYKRIFPVSVSWNGNLKIRYLKWTFPFEKIISKIDQELTDERNDGDDGHLHFTIIRIESSQRRNNQQQVPAQPLPS